MTKELDFTPGRWAISTSPYSVSVGEIQSQTNKTIMFKEAVYRPHRKYKSDICATVSTQDEAITLKQKIDGIRGEENRRVRAAHEWSRAELSKLLE